MGHKIPFGTAEEIAAAKRERQDSVYAAYNKYGYKVNVNHPYVRPLYERYKEKAGEIILSDAQRHDFEQRFFRMIERKNQDE